ncbi:MULTISPECIES: SEC10/PgrA surface exclusion domain-containing protein [Enterococcus]|uniref:SEC10/PgrA surface exclusion domain-containing protein n=1 Tax=Enterococcus TaxID=1350 RepID=UPI00032E3362|nr:SEC10/PgrA surface exclusion domain-containing protein [Enterococcus faecalis]EGO7558091.1 SEC10/PgrA surface exclusion domain-containing protein [Enterococcus faecalis]EGO7929667.1 SEC10/PgrA surface exclusion domain-containing protein [Enterococcus faecalis]EHA3059787.1 SEC10/PgrA surface exclusion domain-containing protein [Enterococcus faecalis]EHK9417954.1 SEC10/PgrA surface exclusion domain-containing protein [Enterococcus faecalis]EHQ9053046.1 SEC10/PgrA surface exclusion domain-cont
MEKKVKVGLGIVAVTGLGVSVGGQQVQAAETVNTENTSTEVAKEAVTSKQTAPQTIAEKQQAVDTQKEVVAQEQAVTDKVKQQSMAADQAVKDQQAVVSKGETAVKAQESKVKEAQQAVEEAKKIVDEATPSAIEKTKEQVATDTQAVDEQQKVVDQAQTDVNQQQAVVDEKAKETNAAKVQNEKDQQAVTAAKHEQAKLEELAKNAEMEKAKAEKEQAAKEAELANKQKEEAKAKDQKAKDDQAVADQQTVVTTSQEKVADAKADTAAKQADLTAKENALKDKQAATKQAQNTLDSSKEELKGHKGINLPANFTPDYYKKLTEQEKQVMEKEALALNKVFPENQADAAKATEMIDIKNPTEKQKKQMSDYFVGLLNDVREKLGLQKLKVSSQNIKFAWDNAKYTNPNEIGHDENAINKAAKENGFKEYPGQNFYENLSGGYFQPKDGKISVLDFERAAREALVDMLFNDGRMGYGHTESLLQADKTNIAIALSEENHGFSSGKIHIIGYNQSRLVDQNTYEEGSVPVFKSKETLQKEVATNQEKLATAQQAESDAQQARSASQQALNTAKTTQATAEKGLSVHKVTLANLQVVATKSTTNYEEKVRQTATAEKSLQQIKDQLATINELIQNRAAVLEKAKANVAEAQAIEQTSANVLKEKQAALKAEEIVLAHLTDISNQREADLVKAKDQLVASKNALLRLENAQPNYEKAVKKLTEAEMKLDKIQADYQASIERLAQLKEEQSVANETYKQAKATLDKEVQYLAMLVSDLQAAKEQQAKEALQQQVVQEQKRLAMEAQQKEMPIQVATSTKKGEQLLTMATPTRQVENKKAAKTSVSPTSYKAMKAEKSSLLPSTGEETNQGMIALGLAIFAGLLGLASADLKRRYKKG